MTIRRMFLLPHPGGWSIHTNSGKDEPMNCKHLNTCSFIQGMNKKIPVVANMMKIKYCESNYDQCARHRLAKVCHMENIPSHISPTDEMKAIELLESKLQENREKLYECERMKMSA